MTTIIKPEEPDFLGAGGGGFENKGAAGGRGGGVSMGWLVYAASHRLAMLTSRPPTMSRFKKRPKIPLNTALVSAFSWRSYLHYKTPSPIP